MSDNEKPIKNPTPPSSVPGRPMGGNFMGGGGRIMPGLDKPKNFGITMKKLLGYLKPFWMPIIFVIIFAILSATFSIVGPKVLGKMTDQVATDYINMTAYDQVTSHLPKGINLPPNTTLGMLLKNSPSSVWNKIPSSNVASLKAVTIGSRPTMNFHRIGYLALIILGLYLLSSLFSYIQGWIMSYVSQRITYRFRKDISDKINRLPLKYFDARPYGDVLSRVTNDVDTVSQSLNQSVTQIITSVTMIIGILIMMLTISWQMTLVALIVLPITFVFINFTIKKSQAYFKSQQDSLGSINGHIEEMYGGHSVMKVFNGEKNSVEKFRIINHRLYDSGWKSQFYSSLLFPITTFVGNLGYVGVSVLGGYLAVKGTLQIGDVQAFIQYMNSFTQPITQTANIANVMQATAAAAERVFEFLEEREESPDPVSPVVLDKINGAVDFDNVVFGYNPDKTIIKNFTAHVKPGARIAIVGPTGAGKTTIVNLLMRFYDIDKGDIKVDGVDIRKMRRTDVRKLFGMVLQDTWLFNGTIRENIAYGKPDATQAQIEVASSSAHVEHFINSLPGGYDMVLNEEASNISQGEKQLLTIARAMLADTPMLILDEATSSVDTRTEILIQKAMDKLMKDKTCFIIAHRLSTIRSADLILVMRDGNIVEQGTHNQLLQKNGFYASLYNSQFETGALEAVNPVLAKV